MTGLDIYALKTSPKKSWCRVSDSAGVHKVGEGLRPVAVIQFFSGFVMGW
jgi:hypothetical protein